MRWTKAAIIGLILAPTAICILGFILPNEHSHTLATVPYSNSWTLYDPDPNHIWNRLYRSLYRRVSTDGREFGYDELDPLLWPNSKYLLADPAYQEVVVILDEFLSTHAERVITDPLKRAILQRDLWAIFDWTTEVLNNSNEKLVLQRKLVQVMKALALTPEQIQKLPQNYLQAVASKSFAPAYDVDKPQLHFLPSDLFQPSGPWVRLSARGGSPIAPAHMSAFSARSVFQVFMRLPEGRDATLRYLKMLDAFPRAWLLNPNYPTQPLPNPEVPQFPAGTQLVLIRQMALIDTNGDFRPTNIVEEVQIRVHRKITSDIPNGFNSDRDEAKSSMDVSGFKLSRPKLFAAQAGGLRALRLDDKEFPIFMSHGVDVFVDGQLDRQLRTPLRSCSSCHFRPGVHSILSRKPEGVLPAWDLNYEADGAKWWKGRQYNWGLLQGLWRS